VTFTSVTDLLDWSIVLVASVEIDVGVLDLVMLWLPLDLALLFTSDDLGPLEAIVARLLLIIITMLWLWEVGLVVILLIVLPLLI